MKTFSSRSNARRALKAFGDKALERADQLIVEVDGKFGFDEDLAELAQYAGVTASDIDDLDTPNRIIGEDKGMNTTHCPNCSSSELYTGEIKGTQGGIGIVVNEEYVIGCHACGWEHREPEADRKVKAPAKKERQVKEKATKVVTKVSSTTRPCQKVWEIADEMLKADPATKRKPILDRCVEAGVAYNTARTQLQYFLTTKK